MGLAMDYKELLEKYRILLNEVSPFARKRRTAQMANYLKNSIGKNIRVIVVTRPKEDFKPKDHAFLQRTLGSIGQ